MARFEFAPGDPWTGGTQPEESGHLVLGTAVDGADVEVQPVLRAPALGHLGEQHSGRHLSVPDVLDGRRPGADLDLPSLRSITLESRTSHQKAASISGSWRP